MFGLTMTGTNLQSCVLMDDLSQSVLIGILSHKIKYCTVLYCTVLYCTVLYCTVLYCTGRSDQVYL